MRDFFHGWRRKAGCITLVMALAATGMWIRSRVVVDEFQFNPRRLTSNILLSEHGQLHWIRRYPCFSVYRLRISSQGLLEDRGDLVEVPTSDRIWHHEGAGFAFGAAWNGTFASLRTRMDYWVIPYWSVAIPLTLLSGYLMLWKPRTKPLEQPDA